jgi:hypothetical protein
MLQLAPRTDWDAWAGNSLPRGVLAPWFVAASYGLSGGLAVYTLFSLFAGSLVGVLCAIAAGNLFGDRRVGFVAGLLVTLQQGLVLSSLLVGPWVWEALAFAAVLCCYTRLRREPGNPAEWLLLGVATGVGIWLRPLFFWALALLPLAMVAWRFRASAGALLAWGLPLLLLVGGLVARNLGAGAEPVPVAGHPAWDFAGTVHPGAVQHAAVPRDFAIISASGGSFPRALWLTLDSTSSRKSLPKVLSRKLREFTGARDEADTFSPDYLRRRSQLLRMCVLAPDTTMAAGWAALLFLLSIRMLPGVYPLTLAILLLHGLLFRTTGMDRLMLQSCLGMLTAGALVSAAEALKESRARAFVYLTVWAAFTLALQIDDHARGPRLRAREFLASASEWRRGGNDRRLREELRDLERVRRIEADLDLYWNQQR